MIRLLEGLVDDAGLFPPTSLPMADALARFRSSSHPMLSGRFLVPGDRLDELSGLLDGPIDVHVVGAGTTTDERIAVRAREGRADTDPDADYLEGLAPHELPEGAFGKVRCLGVGDEELAAWITGVARAPRPFKATAGLHRAVRGWDGEGYHGYLNVLLAVARATSGAKALDAVRETDPTALADEARSLTDDHVMAVRWLFRSYGSCDTAQPVLDAKELDL